MEFRKVDDTTLSTPTSTLGFQWALYKNIFWELQRGTSEVRIGTNCARLMSPDLVILFLSTTYANEVQNQKESRKRPEESQENCQFKQKHTSNRSIN